MSTIANLLLLVFAIAFMGCVLATPLVTRLAAWAGAIDRPDQFRKIHKGAIPRLGGLGLAFGLALSLLPVILGGYMPELGTMAEWWARQWPIVIASVIVLGVGAIDDTKGMGPRMKLLGQAAAVMVLFAGGIRIEKVVLLGLNIPLSYPWPIDILGLRMVLDLPSMAVTLLWFLGCMNVWNLIDGMDGLASGVGLLVSGTLMLVAMHAGNTSSAAMAAALGGSLAGFLLYNWHPACIFLGDSGSLLIGLLIGVIGVQDSLKGTTAVSILFPILAMGLPISDTAMAIFRRWVRNLPLTSADRRHVHHLLIGLGLSPRWAAVALYAFTAFFCGVVLLGVAWNSEFLALVLGVSGCLAYLLILTSRRDELASLWGDFRARMVRGKHERQAAKITWEIIQKIELCDDPERIWNLLVDASTRLGSDHLLLTCYREGQPILKFASDPDGSEESAARLSGPTATFRLPSGQDMQLIVSLHQAAGAELEADIAFRALQRLSLATAQRLERLIVAAERSKPADALLSEAEIESDPEFTPPRGSEAKIVSHATAGHRGDIMALPRSAVSWRPIEWLRDALGLK